MRFLTITVILFLFAGAGKNARANMPDSAATLKREIRERKEPIPQKVLDYMKVNFPGWTIASSRDYNPLWWSFYDKDFVPFSIVADFNDDALVDFVLILKNSDEIKLLFLLGNSDGFRHEEVKDFQNFYGGKEGIEVGLQIEPPGRIDIVYPEEKSLINKSNAVAVMRYEKKTRIYYWKAGELKVFQME